MSAGSADDAPVIAEVEGLKLRWHARELRGSRSLVEAAALVGLNRDELSRIERGETKQIHFRTIAKLLAGYNCSVSELVDVEWVGEEGAALPLYVHAVEALTHGVPPNQPPRRRAVRRSSEADVVEPGDEATFAPSLNEPAPRRRRSPSGTVH